MRWGFITVVVLWVALAGCNSSESLPGRIDDEAPVPVSQAETSHDLDDQCQSEEVQPKVLRFGVTPYLDKTLLEEHFSQVTAYLTRETGFEFELVTGETYQALVGMLDSGAVDIASLSPLTYVLARQKMPCMRLLLTQVSMGSVAYSGYVVTRADSRVTNVDDLAGKRFAFTNRASASGYLFPSAYLKRRGITPETFFGETIFAGSHLEALRLVLSGQVDAAATFSSFMRPARALKLDVGSLRVLAVTGAIPHDATVARPGLNPGVAASVKAALLRLNTSTEEGRRTLNSSVEVNGWVDTRDSVYEPVRERLELLKGDSP